MTEASATGCRAPASATFMTTVTVTTAAMTAAAMKAVMTTETAITAGMTDASVSMGHMTIAATTALTTAGDETTGAAAAGTITDKRAGEVTGTTTGAAAAAVVVGTETTGTEVMTGPEDDFCFFVNNYFEALVNCCTCIKLLIMQPVSIQAYTSHPLCSVLNIYLLK